MVTMNANNTPDTAQATENFLLGPVDPTLAAEQNQFNLDKGQYNQIPSQVSAQNAYQTAMAGYQSQDQKISGQQIGLQQQGAALSQQLGQQQQGYEQSQFNNSYNSAGLGQTAGQNSQNLSDTTYQNMWGANGINTLGNQNTQFQQGIETQQYNLQQGQYPEQQQAQQTAYAQQMMGINAGIATSGAQGSAAAGLNTSAAAQSNQFAQADIARNQAQSQLSQQGEVAGYNTGQQQFGIQQQNALNQQNVSDANWNIEQQQFGLSQQNATLGQQSELAGYTEQYGGTYDGQNYGQGQNALSNQNLAFMAQANGLSEQELTAQLNYGIAQNGQQGQVSADQLLGQMGNLAAGELTTAGQAIAPYAYAGNINAYAPGGAG